MRAKAACGVFLALALALALAGCKPQSSSAVSFSGSSAAPGSSVAPPAFSAAPSQVNPVVEPPAYQLAEVTGRIEANGRWISFAQLPETDAELVVCNLLLCQITGEQDRFAFLYAQGGGQAAQQAIQDALQQYMDGYGLEWIRLEEMETLADAQRLATYENPQTGLPLLQAYYEKIAGDTLAYTQRFLEWGNHIVRVRYTCSYTEVSLHAETPVPDGEREVFFHLKENPNGQLQLVEETTLTGAFYGAAAAG